MAASKRVEFKDLAVGDRFKFSGFRHRTRFQKSGDDTYFSVNDGEPKTFDTTVFGNRIMVGLLPSFAVFPDPDHVVDGEISNPGVSMLRSSLGKAMDYLNHFDGLLVEAEINGVEYLQDSEIDNLKEMEMNIQDAISAGLQAVYHAQRTAAIARAYIIKTKKQ